MKIKCNGWHDGKVLEDNFNYEYELKDGLQLKSITTKLHGIQARVELTCPECGQTEYMILRQDFRISQFKEKAKNQSEEERTK